METRSQGNGGGAVRLAVVRPGYRATGALAGSELPTPIAESTARMLGAAAVLGIGVIHILDAAGTYHSTRWIFWAYVALIVSAVPVALVLLHWASPLAWAAAGGLAAGPFFGYLWSRTIGLPGDAPDIGNWLCTLGMVALFVEASLLALGATRLGVWRRSR